MCGGRPCFTSVCGVSLQHAIMVLGGVQLVLTLIATLLNSLKYSRISGVFDEDFDESCGDVEVCIGPIIKVSCTNILGWPGPSISQFQLVTE